MTAPVKEVGRQEPTMAEYLDWLELWGEAHRRGVRLEPPWQTPRPTLTLIQGGRDGE